MRALAILLLCALAVGAATASLDMSPSVMAHVATSFATKGFAREDPFELSPLQAARLDAQLPQMLQESLIEAESEANGDPAVVLASLQEQVSTLENQNAESMTELEQRAKQNDASLVAPEFLESEATIHKRGIFGKVLNAGKNLLNKITGRDHHHHSNGQFAKFSSQNYEDCMACRFIWKQVEMDVSTAKYVEDVQASFEHNCLDAQKSPIFYKACEDMYDDMYAMTDDYMSSDFTVDKMCQRSNMCKF